MSPNLRTMEYAVRGAVVIAADKINDELAKSRSDDGESSATDYPFDHIVYTNIGNPQSVGQKPLTWPRQVLALVDLPDEVGVNHPNVHTMFPADAIRRAKEVTQSSIFPVQHNISHSGQGIPFNFARNPNAKFQCKQESPESSQTSACIRAHIRLSS